MSVSLSTLRSTDYGEIGERIRQVAEQRNYTLSRFYCLYYLTKIEGVSETQRPYETFRDWVQAGLYWYGLYAVASELSNFGRSYGVDGVSWRTLPAEIRVEHLDYEGVSDETADLLLNQLDPLDRGTTNSDLPTGVAIIDEAVGAFYDPVAFLQLAREVFSMRQSQKRAQAFVDDPNEYPPGISPAEAYDDGGTETTTTGWAYGFNGPSWVAIIDHLLDVADENPTIWVDTAISLEHNTGEWMDKAGTADVRQDVLAFVPVDDGMRPDQNRGRHILNYVLDDVHSGDLTAAALFGAQPRSYYPEDVDIGELMFEVNQLPFPDVEVVSPPARRFQKWNADFGDLPSSMIYVERIVDAIKYTHDSDFPRINNWFTLTLDAWQRLDDQPFAWDSTSYSMMYQLWVDYLALVEDLIRVGQSPRAEQVFELFGGDTSRVSPPSADQIEELETLREQIMSVLPT